VRLRGDVGTGEGRGHFGFDLERGAKFDGSGWQRLGGFAGESGKPNWEAGAGCAPASRPITNLGWAIS